MLLSGLQIFSGVMAFSFLLFILLLGLFSFLLSVYIVYWTYKDATRRGMDSPELWALVVVFGNIPGFIAYLVVRE